MSKQDEVLLMLDLKPSKWLKRTLALLHVIALIASIVNSLIISVKLGLCIGVCAHYWRVISSQTKPHYQIRHSDRSGWQVSSKNGIDSVEILKSSIITIFFIILHIKSQYTDKLTILVVFDALSDDDYRRLIVQLKTTGILNKRCYDGRGKP
jgi:toxin CptA